MGCKYYNLIAAVVLFAYGTGPIKGFSLTISIGILASMLTAILGTHGIYQYILPKIDKSRLSYWFGVDIKGKKVMEVLNLIDQQ